MADDSSSAHTAEEAWQNQAVGLESVSGARVVKESHPPNRGVGSPPRHQGVVQCGFLPKPLRWGASARSLPSVPVQSATAHLPSAGEPRALPPPSTLHTSRSDQSPRLQSQGSSPTGNSSNDGRLSERAQDHRATSPSRRPEYPPAWCAACDSPQIWRPAPRRAPPRSDSIYSKRSESRNRLPTRADGAARSEFERAARYGTLRAPPTTTPPKLTEATLGFSSTRKTIDTSPGWRYSSDQKKRLFKFPIRNVCSSGIFGLRLSIPA